MEQYRLPMMRQLPTLIDSRPLRAHAFSGPTTGKLLILDLLGFGL
jgi:hypothetical protein